MIFEQVFLKEQPNFNNIFVKQNILNFAKISVPTNKELFQDFWKV